MNICHTVSPAGTPIGYLKHNDNLLIGEISLQNSCSLRYNPLL